MRLLFKQRVFSWLDSYDIYDEAGRTVFTVEGKFGWGHKLHILDAAGRHIGTVQERLMTFLPQFEIYEADRYIGCIRKEFSLFVPKFTVDFRGWWVQGELFEWDYQILDAQGNCVAVVTKELLRWSDTYVIDVRSSVDAFHALMVVLAIDAEKCSRN